MITKTITGRTITTFPVATDLNSIRRLLVAAVIDPVFCACLLKTPGKAVREGFGGEDFPLTDNAYEVIASIRAGTLTEFIYLLDEQIPIL
ncbi:MAG TPA: hypothetical protein PK152_18300 [Anaerolineales bacterium]|nr:hypothetical protein [Anaerolineales bacterium]HRK91083.1 hypothetical protein [Anaerolineales bacterium]